MNDNNQNKLIELLLSELQKLEAYIRDNERTKNLRPEILDRFLGLILTDDERADLYGLPDGCRIREAAKIICPEKLVCGEHLWIGEGAIIDASGGLEIGSHTTIGSYVLIWSHTSYLASTKLANKIGSSLISRKPTKIGKGCFIGGPSVIYPGVTIMDQTVVLPMSVVTKDISEGKCIAGGVPAKKIRDLSDQELD